MSLGILLTTTGTLNPVPIADLGKIPGFPHPTVNYDLGDEFTEEKLRYSASLQAVVTAGHITLKDTLGNSITDVATQIPAKLILNKDGASLLMKTKTLNLIGPGVKVSLPGVGVADATMVQEIVTATIVDSPYVPADNIMTIIADTTGGAIIVNLPDATLCKGRILNIKKKDSTSNTVTINGFGGTQKIDADTVQIIRNRWVNIQMQSDGVNWLIL